jgi:predicted DCC family thiol-disulfide oxidoreductase YuxK
MQDKIILFDDVCNLCHCWVKFVIHSDRNKVLRFASLQSETGQALLKQYQIPADKLRSVVFLDNGKVYTHSSAALRICKYLKGVYRLFYVLRIIPKPLRDALYHLIARNRYAWFGKSTTCLLPTTDIQDRFI